MDNDRDGQTLTSITNKKVGSRSCLHSFLPSPSLELTKSMFNLIRRISYGVIPRPDRPWEDDRKLLHPHPLNACIFLPSSTYPPSSYFRCTFSHTPFFILSMQRRQMHHARGGNAVIAQQREKLGVMTSRPTRKHVETTQHLQWRTPMVLPWTHHPCHRGIPPR